MGATVDLKSPSAFDYGDEDVFSITGRGIYNEVSENVDPRVSMLFGRKLIEDRPKFLQEADHLQLGDRFAVDLDALAEGLAEVSGTTSLR